MRKATRTQWIKCSIAILLYLIFLIWVKSWWGLIIVPFIFDIYITKKIPWSFWKKSKNPTPLYPYPRLLQRFCRQSVFTR